ncbi:DUF4177 domain-containing protein [Nocardiopsis composta]|uniref:DUF4177 domain-containing protein n=1 Tax=Nocardiopsis composta TaxID=157465 RepID=A0A7W8QTD5_9ACTN|nr:DUF4177 domain-containing protein [Nocardiopsis composta]MBB5436174.1 hypothetical protein [Nocardiopsis composta]
MPTCKLRMKGFDYEQIERDLDELGGQGWETVGSIAPSFGPGQAIEIGVVLKRPRTW